MEAHASHVMHQCGPNLPAKACIVPARAQKEEREVERLREAEQRRATKELLAAQRQEEELRLKRNLDERRREKEEEARARDKIRVKLGAAGAPLAGVLKSGQASRAQNPEPC